MSMIEFDNRICDSLGNKIEPDILVSVRFFPQCEGGRKMAVQGGFYSCPMAFAGEMFDCRLLLGGRLIELGALYEVSVKFLYRDLALSKARVGVEFFLWEMRSIAQGKIIFVF